LIAGLTLLPLAAASLALLALGAARLLGFVLERPAARKRPANAANRQLENARPVEHVEHAAPEPDATRRLAA
jgi:hypothetical protein